MQAISGVTADVRVFDLQSNLLLEESQSLDLPAGSLQTRDRDVLIRLGDVARITDRFELDEAKIVFNGKRAASLKVSKSFKEDTLVAIDAVPARL